MNSYILISIIGIVVLILAIAAIVGRKADENQGPDAASKLPQSPQNPNSDPIGPDGDELENQKRTKKILIGISVLIMLVGIGFAVYMGTKSGGGSGSGGHEDWSVSSAAMIPIWVAVFIPILANKKKRQQLDQGKSPERPKQFMALVVGLVVAMILGMIFFVLRLR